MVKGQSPGSENVQPWALCHTYWPGLREVELLAPVHTEQPEAELHQDPEGRWLEGVVGVLVDVSPRGSAAWPALLGKGQGAPVLWSQMLLRAKSSPREMGGHTQGCSERVVMDKSPGMEPCYSSQLGVEILPKSGQPVNPAAGGWSGMQAAGNSELLLIVVGCACPPLGPWGVVWRCLWALGSECLCV